MRTALLFMLLLLTSCRVGPNYRAPDPPQHAEGPLKSVREEDESRAAPPDAWWQLYGDTRMDALVVGALTANRDLAVAEANLAAAHAVLSAVRANRYPSTNIVAGGLRGRDPTTDEILEFTGRRPENIWLYEDLFQAAYEVDLFGRVHRQIEAAAANQEVAAALRDSVRVVVASETVRAYAAICTLGEQVEVSHRSLDLVSHQAEIADRRLEAGGGTPYEVKRAQALVEQVRADIPSLEGQRRAAVFALAALLGRTPADAPSDTESCVQPPHLGVPLPVGDGASLIRRRPDIRQAESRLAVATAQIGVATADLYPTIRLVGFYGGAAPEISDLGTNVGLAWGTGPLISWNFFNQSAARARVRQAKASQAAALASFDSVVLGALKEVEQALTVYEAALERHAALLAARQRIHEAFDMASDEHAAGAISSLDLLTTEQSLVALDAAVAASDSTLVVDQIAVFKALGGGWASGVTPPAAHR
jgi:NodT family efflux transporter outer membrane factor (OMF) lipoprotein